MDIPKINDIKSKIHYEVSRTKPPEGFPKFHDIPKGRYTSQEFYELEQKYVFSDSWVVAGRVFSSCYNPRIRKDILLF